MRELRGFDEINKLQILNLIGLKIENPQTGKAGMSQISYDTNSTCLHYFN